MKTFIEVTEEFLQILNQINMSLSEVEVKGDSVKHLFDARVNIQKMLSKTITQKEIINSVEELKKEVEV